MNTELLIWKKHPDAILPEHKSSEAAAIDLHLVEGITLYPGRPTLGKFGLVVQPPEGFHTELLIRSSLALKQGVCLLNSVGLIDRDYAGENDELGAILCLASNGNNYWQPSVRLEKGTRVAQLLLRKTYFPTVVEVFQAPSTVDRGGYGSTGEL